VHRDIKPANILITADGHPKIADFGIAKLNQSHLTLPGRVLGSPAYMAPEQLSDEDVDGRSDLFSLGVILYVLLTGHRPFQGNSTTTVCFKLVNHDPLPVSAFETKFPPELDTIVSRAIAKDPAQRYQSGMAMASDLQGLRESSGFVNGNVDWTVRSLKRNAITRNITSLADSASALENNKTTQSSGLWFPSTNGLAYALLAAAMAAVIFFGLQHTKLGLSGPNKIALAVQQTSRSDHSSNKDRTRTTIPVLRAKASPPSVTVPARPEIVRVAEVPADATLRIEIDHHFIDGRASVWLDKDLVYAHSLRGDPKRRGFIFRRVEGHQFEAIRVAAGKHDVRVRIQSAAESYDQSKTMADAMIGTNESMLRIVCGKKPGQLQLILR
jgi:serine/threonine protein kinase